MICWKTVSREDEYEECVWKVHRGGCELCVLFLLVLLVFSPPLFGFHSFCYVFLILLDGSLWTKLMQSSELKKKIEL